MKSNFAGQTVFLTGGSRGIGKGIKELFIARGANVVAPERNELDLSSCKSIQSYLQNHTDLAVDMFIHCAGVNELAGIEEITEEVMARVFQINLFAPTELLHTFAQRMKSKRQGRIVLISSLYAIVSRERRIAYSASKNALTGLMKSLALELAPYQILVNAVAPGYVMTEMTKKNLSQEEIEGIQANIPTGRFQTETDIAELVAFLCSSANNSITGQLIAVDGGFTCK